MESRPRQREVGIKYYAENILGEACLTAVNRTPSDGSVLKRRMVAERSKTIFIHDRSPAYRSPHNPAVVPRQPAALLIEGVAREQSRPKSHRRTVDNPPIWLQQTEASNQHPSAGEAAQVSVVTKPTVCALQSRGQYAELYSQLLA